MKLKSLLPDAMVIIALHEFGLWADMCKRTDVIVPSVITHETRFFIDPYARERVEIDLRAQVTSGEIQEAEAESLDMMDFLSNFDSVVADELHPGELEALTLLYKGQLTDCRFCSADQTAVKALVLAGLEQGGVSLEDALKEAQLGKGMRLPRQYRETCFQRWVREARIARIQGIGWTKPLY